jgi:hypothetical protein
MPDQQAAEEFVTDPGAWADPALVAPLIAPGLRTETARHLFTSPRLAGRASRWLADRLGRGEAAALEPVDLALASACSAVLDAVALRAGAVWHARRVRGLVLGTDIALLCTRLGEAARNAALRHVGPDHAVLAQVAANSTDIDGSAADDAGALADDIARDGAHCIFAWVDALPDWVALRVRLKFPTLKFQSGSDWSAGMDLRACAVRIVRTLAAEELAI